MESREMINEVIEMIMKLRVKSVKEPVTELDLYNVNNELYKVIESLSPPPSKEVVSDEEIIKKLHSNDWNIDEPFQEAAKWMRSRLSNVKEGDYYKRKYDALSDWLLLFRVRTKDALLKKEIESVLMSNPPLLEPPLHLNQMDKSDAVDMELHNFDCPKCNGTKTTY